MKILIYMKMKKIQECLGILEFNMVESLGIFQKIVENAEYKIGITELMESQDYQYPIDAWLQDFEMDRVTAGGFFRYT